MMNKSELIDAIAESAELTKKKAGDALDALMHAVSGALSGGKDVQLIGFGTFSVTERAARKGRNPRTGEEIDIAASKNVKFKAGKELKEKVQ